jgi:hypothetical protein
MGIDDPAASNEFRYWQLTDLNNAGQSSTLGSRQVVGGLGGENDGGGLAIGYIDGNTVPDVVLMGIDSPDGENPFWYRVGWDLGANGAASRWTETISVGGIGTSTAGGGAALGYIDDNDVLDLVLMGIDDPQGSNEFRYRIGFNLDGNGRAQSWSGTKAVPGLGYDNAGGGATITYLNDDSRPDLVLMGIDEAAVNNFRYRVAWDLDEAGTTGTWSEVIEISGIGTATAGGGVAVARVDADDLPDLILMGIDDPGGSSGDQFRYKVGFGLGTNGRASRWGDWYAVNGLGASNAGGGIEVLQDPVARARLASPQTGSNGLVNLPVGESTSLVLSLEPEAAGTIVEVHWKKVVGNGRTTDAYEWSTSGAETNLSFTDPGTYTVYCAAVAQLGGRKETLAPLAIPVRVWNRPTAGEKPPQARIDAGDVSWHGGKYVGVVGDPVRLMGQGQTATTDQGEAIAKVLWDLDNDWSTVEVEQPADAVRSYTWDDPSENAQIRCKVVTNYGIHSHEARDAGRTFGLTVYAPAEVDPRTDPGDAYTGRVNAVVSLKGGLTQQYSGSTVEYQWRVNSPIPQPQLKSSWAAPADAMQKTGYVELTDAQSSRHGQMEYADLALSDDWSVTGELQSGGGSGADAFYVYVWANATPTGEATNQGNYSIAFDEYQDQIQLIRNGVVLSQVSQPLPLDNGEWRPFRIVFVEGRFRIYLDHQLRLEYNDGTAYASKLDSARQHLGHRYCGVGARTGGLHNYHRVRQMTWAAGTPIQTNAQGEAEYTWTTEGTHYAGLTVRVTTPSGLILEDTENAKVIVEAGRPTAMPGGPYRGGIAGGDHSPIQFEGNHPDFVEASDVGKIKEWLWYFPDAGNRGLSLDGQDDRVVAGPFADFPSGAVTLELWAKTTDDTRDGTLISYAASGGSADELGIYNHRNLDLRVAGVQSSTPRLAINDGYWHHLAMTWARTDGILRLFVDGAETFRDTVALGDALAANGYLVVGQDQDAVNGGFEERQAFAGLVDDVALWRTARTAEEILGDLQGNLAGTEDGLVLYWRFEQDRDSTAVDATGQHPGGLVGTSPEAWAEDGRPAVTRGVWNPAHAYPAPGKHQASLRVRAESGKWSGPGSAEVTVVEGRIAGAVRAADLRTPVREVRLYLSSAHVEREALVRAAAADTSLHTTAGGELWVHSDANGRFEFGHLPLGTYRVRAAKGEGDQAHEFEQTVRPVELTLNGPQQQAVDFVDLSVFPVGGRIAYSVLKNGQEVYESGVTVTAQPVGSTSAIEGLPSTKALTATGTNYSVPLFAGQYLLLAKKEGRDIRLNETTTGYDEGTGLVRIEGARTDVDFIDHTTYALTVQVRDPGDHPVTVYPAHFSNAGAPIKVTVSGDNGQVSEAQVSTEDEGVLEVRLNPGVYTVRIPGAEPEEKEVDLTGGDAGVEMVMPVKLVLTFDARPRLLDVSDEFLAQFGLEAEDNPEGYMYYYPPEPRTHSYLLRATANGHPVDYFILTVQDEVSMLTEDPPEEAEYQAVADSIAYQVTAGYPKRTQDDPPLAAAKRITFKISKDGYEESDAVTDSVFVLGDVPVGTAARVVAIPVVNYTVLHDPPGDGSYAYLDDAMTIKGLVTGMQIKINDETIPVYPSPWRDERSIDDFEFEKSPTDTSTARNLGTKGLLGYQDSDPTVGHFIWAAALEAVTGAAVVVTGPVGYAIQIVKLGVKTAAIEPVGTSAGVVQYEVSPTRHLETPSGDEQSDLLGPGRGDIYYGEGWTLGLQTKYRLGLENANADPAGSPVWRLTTRQVETYDILDRTNQYVYTVRDVENLIDDLGRTIDDPETAEGERGKLGNARKAWQDLLNGNLAYVWDRRYVAEARSWEDFHQSESTGPLDKGGVETLIFSAGPIFEYTREVTASHGTSFSTGISLGSESEYSNEFKVSIGWEWAGNGATFEYKTGSSTTIGSETSYGAEYESGVSSTQRVGFVLHDDDVGDNLSTRVYADPVWGTPIFFQDAGSVTSDPWEGGTNKGVDVTLELLEEPEGAFDYHEGADYKVKVTYTGMRDLEALRFDFVIQTLAVANPDNAYVEVNGNWPPYVVGLDGDKPSAVLDVLITPPKSDQENNHEKQYSVQIMVEEDGDQQISRSLTLAPTFADLQAPRVTVVSPYEGQRLSPVLFPTDHPFAVQMVTSDLDAARIQMQIRAKQPDGVWEPWRNLSGMAWDAGSENPAVTVFDRLDQRPAVREFTMSWPGDQIRALGVGEYALRAVATDGATSPNTDLAPPVVQILVDEAKPSVLNTVPDFQGRDSERIYRGELSVTFTDDMRAGDFDDRAFQVTDLLDQGAKVAGYVSYSPALRKAVFVPVVPFQPNGYYRAEIRTDDDSDGDGEVDVRGVRDLAGNPLDNGLVWTFRTTDAPFEPTWSIVLSVTDGQGIDGNQVAAVEYGAMDGEEEKDARAVPGLASQLRMSLLDRDGIEYERDVRPADGRLSHHWFPVVRNAASGSRVTLSWQPSLVLTKTTRDYQVIRLVEFDDLGNVTNAIPLDPTEARVNPETGLIDPVAIYTYTNQGEQARYFRLDVQKASLAASAWPAGTSGWRFFSVPIVPQRAEPFVNLGDDLDPFRLYQYETAIGGYKVYPFDLGEVALVLGHGYFTRVEEDVEVDVGGSTNRDAVTLELESAGWHAVGNPFLVPVAVSDLQVDGTSFAAAVADGRVEGTLYRWAVVSSEEAYLSDPPRSDRYEAVAAGDSLRPWEGYWLRTRRDGLELTLPPPAGVQTAEAQVPPSLRPPIARAVAMAAAPSPGDGEFDLTIGVLAPGSSDVTTTLGCREDGRPDRDVFDLTEPPTLGQTVAGWFDHPEWGGGETRYNTDYASVLQPGEERTWRLTAFSDSPGSEVWLSWAASIGQVPGDVLLHCRRVSAGGVSDEGEAAWQDMRQVTSLALGRDLGLASAALEVRARRFDLTPPAAVELIPGEREMVLRWRPNPSETVEGYTVLRQDGFAAGADSGMTVRGELPQLPGQPLAEFVDREVNEETTYTYQLIVRYRTGAQLASGRHSAATRAVIAGTALLQSYPNPANPEVWLPFELDREAPVRLEIYDVAGQRVRALNLGSLPRGRYAAPGRAAHWDGRDEAGQAVGSGVYVYRLMAGPEVQTRRLVLLR